MGITKSSDCVGKFITLKRYQRDWINNHKAINFSGLCQVMVDEVIKENDINYLLSNPDTIKVIKKRSESTQSFIPKILN